MAHGKDIAQMVIYGIKEIILMVNNMGHVNGIGVMVN
jgi:hypothetical protein